MPMRVIPVPIWTAPFWRATPIRSLKAWPFVPVRYRLTKGIVYVRAEYPLAVKLLTEAIRQAEELGFWEDILGTGLHLKVSVFQGSGAFVCGEETALSVLLRAYRGMPRHRPPYPAGKGYGADQR